MSRKALIILLLLMLVLGSAVSVSAQNTSTIGLAVPTLEGEFYGGVIAGAQEAAAALGVDLVVLSSENDLETEAANIASLIEQGVDAILLDPTSAVDSLPAIAAANEAGIPVFILGDDLELSGADVEIVSTIGLDSATSGALAGEFLCASIGGSGAVLEVVNRPELEDSTLAALAAARSESFNAFMAESCADASISNVDISGLTETEMVSAITAALRAGNFNAVFATDDNAILLAMRATLRARLTGLTLFGFNASDDALGAIQLGRLGGVVAPIAADLGGVSVETAAAFLAGETVEPQVFAEAMIVNADNLLAVRNNCRPGRPECNQGN